MTATGAATAQRWTATRRGWLLLAGGSLATASGVGWLLADGEGQKRAEAETARDLRAAIERSGGFRIVTDDLQARIGPSVILPDRPVNLADLGDNQLEALRSLEAALRPYPGGFLRRFLDEVALAGEVTFWSSTPVGGFFFPRGLCLNAGNPADAGDVLTRLFHHELSSLVRQGSTFDAARWQACNPASFAYLDEAAYRELLRRQPHAAGNEALYAEGFVRPYGKSDLDNDWNTYAEEVFGDGRTFARLIGPYTRMRAKTGLLVAVYQALDSGFARYFAEIGLQAAIGDL